MPKNPSFDNEPETPPKVCQTSSNSWPGLKLFFPKTLLNPTGLVHGRG